MATSKKYHLMKRTGSARGKTEDAPQYSFKRYDIVEAPATEFEHLGGDVETYDSEKAAEAAKKKLLKK